MFIGRTCELHLHCENFPLSYTTELPTYSECQQEVLMDATSWQEMRDLI